MANYVGNILIADDEEGLSFVLREHLFWERMKAKGIRCNTTEVQGYIIQSCLVRWDELKAEMLLTDWMQAPTKPSAYVTKWNPGSHYYALDQKFGTESEARRHLENKGYRCLGVTERHFYTRQGD